MVNLTEGLIWYAVFLLSTTVHEAAHAFTAHKMGDSTAYDTGQVSLNPLPHIKREPIGTVVVPIFSFFAGGWMIGWASTPYNVQWAFNHPKKAAAMAAAGPISNFILVILAGLLIHIGIWTGLFYAPETITISSIVGTNSTGALVFVTKVLSVMFSLNLILFVFNLIPLPPLDGSGILPMYLSDDTGRKYMKLIRTPALFFVGLFIAWKLFDLIYFKIHLVFINLLYPGGNYH